MFSFGSIKLKRLLEIIHNDGFGMWMLLQYVNLTILFHLSMTTHIIQVELF